MSAERPTRKPVVASAIRIDADIDNDPIVKMLDENMEEIASMPLSNAGVQMLMHRLTAFHEGWVRDHLSMMIH